MPQQPILFLEPFEAWGIDYVGPIGNEGSRYRYIIVCVDYLTKWAEARAVKVADARATVKFLKEVIFPRFGYPLVLISDNGTHFVNDKVKTLLKHHGIEHRLATPYHP